MHVPCIDVVAVPLRSPSGTTRMLLHGDAAPVDGPTPEQQPRHLAWWRHHLRRIIVVAVVVLPLPVPWQHKADSALGIAWGMDNRLVVEGQRLDPPGQYSFLTVGRPALVAELLWGGVAGVFDDDTMPVARDLRDGEARLRPVNVEPIAAAVGLAAARGDVPDGGGITPVDAVMGGHGPPYSWVRKMSMGSSHGMMVGLVTYAARSGEDLTGGRHVAGTGQLFSNGAVGIIGGLRAKASGALRAGADVLLVPAMQLHELDAFESGDMIVVGVHSLGNAIKQLRALRDAHQPRVTRDVR